MSEKDLLRALAYMHLKNAANQAAEQVSSEWRAKQDDWYAIQEKNIGRWTNSYNNNILRIRKVDSNLKNLNEMKTNIKNKARLEKIGIWIEEANAYLMKLEIWNQELAKKISAVECKLNNSHDAKPWFYRDSLNPFGGKTIYFRISPTLIKR